MRITVDDCLNLDVFSEGKVVSCKRKRDRRVKTLSVFDENNIEVGISRNGVKEQMVLTHFWNFKDDIQAQCSVIIGLGKKNISALVILLCDNGVKAVDSKVIKCAEENGVLIIAMPDSGEITYSKITEQVMDKILYGNNYTDNMLNNTIYHLLNFEKHSNFQSALMEAAIHNDYQVVLMTSEFNPILSVETRHKETVDYAISLAKRNDIKNKAQFTLIKVHDVITYWGTVVIGGIDHILMIVDNEDNYSAKEIKKVAEIIELAMGMWKYTPERDSRSEFIKSAVRGDLSFCYTMIDDAEMKNKNYISVFYARGVDETKTYEILDDFKNDKGLGMLLLPEGNELYGMIYTDDDDENIISLKNATTKLYEQMKNGRKDIRILHNTGIETLDAVIDGFKLINETWNYVEKVFPYKRVFTKYDMSMVYNCINISMQETHLKKLYINLLEPFEREISLNKGRLLLETLETFVLDAGMNSVKTSEFMNVHNNTVQYRLKRINEILGAELTGNRIIPGLTMALALRRLEKK